LAYQTLRGIVLRRTNWRESDRIVSLLTMERGKVDVVLRGARKPKSAMLPAGEVFTLGEYVLYKGRGHEMATAFTLLDAYYPLRSDYERLSFAVLALKAAEGVAQKEAPEEHLFILLARTLARLAYGEKSPEEVTAAFLWHLCGIEGFRPDTGECTLCQKPLESQEGAYLSSTQDGLICQSCAAGERKSQWIAKDQLLWLKDIETLGVDKMDSPLQVPFMPIVTYVEDHLGFRLMRS
jgi:DNA repair protein RecO (recombination protein O)